MDSLLRDIRYAARALAKSPGFTVVAVLTLALGIGANTTLFSIVSPMLLKPLPYRGASRIVSVTLTERNERRSGSSSPHWAYRVWRDRARTLVQVSAYNRWAANVEGRTGPERLQGAAVTGEFFALLGARPVFGTSFAGADTSLTTEGPPTVILSHGAWTRLFAGDTGIVGHTITYNGSPATVAGVMPATFDFPRGAEFWTPMKIRTAASGPGGKGGGYVTYYINIIGRSAPGVSSERVRSELDGLWRADEAESGPGWRDARLSVVSLRERLYGESRPRLLLLFGAVGVVLLIACANLASMLVARAASREREFAIRAAIGAGRVHVVRQVLVESVLLSLLGGAVGVLVARWGIDLFTAVNPASVKAVPPIRIDAAVLGFTGAVAIATGILFGLAPAVSVSRISLADTLKAGGFSVASAGGRPVLRRMLVVGQLAAALVLVIGAALVTRSLLRFLAVDPGFRSRGVVAADVYLSRSSYATTASANVFRQALLDRVSEMPGIQSAALADAPPLGGFQRSYSFRLDGALDVQGAMAHLNAVTPEYFRTVGATLARGHGFSSQDVPGAPSVAVVNEAFVHDFLGGRDPLGHTILLPDPAFRPLTIVGEVRDMRQVGRDEPAEPEIFLAAAQSVYMPGTLVAKTSGDRAAIAAAIRQVVRTIDRSLPVARLYWLDDELSQGALPRRANAVLLGLFGALAAVIAGMGLYGLMAFVVAQRTREIGVRLALGAGDGDVLRLVVRQAAPLVGGGLLLGLVAALALVRILRAMVFGITVHDPATFAAAPVLLVAVALAATYVPARRALSVDPLIALRAE